MEPLKDDELRQAASSWKAPATPDHLRSRIFGARRPWWSWVFTGSIRVPVPVCAALALLFVWLAWVWPQPEVAGPVPAGDRRGEVTLADFEPNAEVQVRVVGDLR